MRKKVAYSIGVAHSSSRLLSRHYTPGFGDRNYSHSPGMMLISGARQSLSGLLMPKTAKAAAVPMNKVLLSALKTCKINHSSEEQVFRTYQGTPYRSYRSAFERAVHKAGIENFTFHDLRHTFASRLAMAGVDLPTLQESMGHKDIKMTLRYTHLSSDHKRRAVAALVGFGEKVPSIFTTRYSDQDVENSQDIDFIEMGR